jgi:hypothetical protein
MQDAGSEQADSAGVDLVLALCHEIGNFVGAVRLHAHLLEPGLSPLELNQTSVELDDLSARSAALLMQIRPLLRADPADTPACSPAGLMAEMSALLHEQGGRGAALEVVAPADGLPRVKLGANVLRAILSGFAFHAIEAAKGKGFVRLGVESTPAGVAFSIEDDAEAPEDLRDWRNEALRGRPLQCAVASHILTRAGGQLEVGRDAGVTRIALVVPAPGDV